MFGSEILEVFLGILFVYIVVSIFVTALREGIEGWLKMRASFLEYGIRELLHSREVEGLADELYKHPLIFGLYVDGFTPKRNRTLPTFFSSLFSKQTNLPSYIPPSSFATALLDLAARGPVRGYGSTGTPALTAQDVRKNVRNLQNASVERVLLTVLDSSQDDLVQARAQLEEWYNSGMERVSGWYKRSTQTITFWIALISALALNVNTVTIAEFLYTNGAVRAVIVKRAETIAAKPAAGETGAVGEVRSLGGALAEITALQLPIGWGTTEATATIHELVSVQPGKDFVLFLKTAAGWGMLGVGWLMTALAGMLGAPFWFDMLNKVIVIRSTVKPREKSREQGTKDSESITT